MKQVESTWACLKGAFMSIYTVQNNPCLSRIGCLYCQENKKIRK